MTEEFNRDSVTTDNIRSLRTEAASAGDLDQVAICDRALAGDRAAREDCIDAIEDAWAQAQQSDAVRDCDRLYNGRA